MTQMIIMNYDSRPCSVTASELCTLVADGHRYLFHTLLHEIR